MLTTTCEQDIQWLGLRFAVPAGWQVVRHSLTPRRGGLVLVDRYRQRMQLNWTTLPAGSVPDLARMIEDYRAKQLEAQPNAALEELDGTSGWVGVTRTFGVLNSEFRVVEPETLNSKLETRNSTSLTRAVRFDEPSGRVLEAIIQGEAGDEEGLVEQLLGSVRAVEPMDGVTRLRCFDLDITTPADWRLARTDVKPADVTLRYGHADEKGRETRQELIVRRMGMADTWWHGDAARFVRGSSPDVDFAIDERTYGGRTATRGVGVEPGPRAKRVLGLLRRREDLVWHETRANAVFHVTTLSWAKRAVAPDLFHVADASGWAYA